MGHDNISDILEGSGLSGSQIDIDEHDSGYIPQVRNLPSGRLEREELMEFANDLIRFLHTRTMDGRFRKEHLAGHKMRLAYAHTELNAIKTYATLLKDDEIENMQTEIAALKQAISKD